MTKSFTPSEIVSELDKHINRPDQREEGGGGGLAQSLAASTGGRAVAP